MRIPSIMTCYIVALVCPDALSGTHDAKLPPETTVRVAAWLELSPSDRPPISTLDLPSSITAGDATAIAEELWTLVRESHESKAMLEELGPLPEPIDPEESPDLIANPRSARIWEFEMPFVLIRREQSQPPDAGRPLFICMHGGGASPSAEGPHAWSVNTREWQTQARFASSLYAPDGLYFVPRMADDRLGRWWHSHNQLVFERVIRCAILHWGVDPNRIYLLGISEGGYGTAILAPFMPDLFAGANSMAAGVGIGNPPENLANIAFRSDVGERDTTFDRVGLARAFHDRLEELEVERLRSRPHAFAPQAGRGHGIDYRPGVEWISKFTREPAPELIVWTSRTLHGERRNRNAWIRLASPDDISGVVSITARFDKPTNLIKIETFQQTDTTEGYQAHATEGVKGMSDAQRETLRESPIEILLDDRVANLDKPLTVIVDGRERAVFVSRDAEVILETLLERFDPTSAFSAKVSVAPHARVDP